MLGAMLKYWLDGFWRVTWTVNPVNEAGVRIAEIKREGEMRRTWDVEGDRKVGRGRDTALPLAAMP